MRIGDNERAEPMAMQAKGGATQRLGGPSRRHAAGVAGVAVALACAIAACGPSESVESASGPSPSPSGSPQSGAVQSGPDQSDSSQSGAAAPLSLTLDVDGDGEVTSYADAMLIMRYVSGFRGEALTEGAVAPGCKRCTADEIGEYIDSL